LKAGWNFGSGGMASIQSLVERYSISEDRWYQRAPLIESPHGLLTATCNGFIYCLSPGSVNRYDPEADVWTRVVTLNQGFNFGGGGGGGCTTLFSCKGRLYATSGTNILRFEEESNKFAQFQAVPSSLNPPSLFMTSRTAFVTAFIGNTLYMLFNGPVEIEFLTFSFLTNAWAQHTSSPKWPTESKSLVFL
jgi:hypothetical protein